MKPFGALYMLNVDVVLQRCIYLKVSILLPVFSDAKMSLHGKSISDIMYQTLYSIYWFYFHFWAPKRTFNTRSSSLQFKLVFKNTALALTLENITAEHAARLVCNLKWRLKTFNLKLCKMKIFKQVFTSDGFVREGCYFC